jgi:hypothetical protein
VHLIPEIKIVPSSMTVDDFITLTTWHVSVLTEPSSEVTTLTKGVLTSIIYTYSAFNAQYIYIYNVPITRFCRQLMNDLVLNYLAKLYQGRRGWNGIWRGVSFSFFVPSLLTIIPALFNTHCIPWDMRDPATGSMFIHSIWASSQPQNSDG